MHLTQRILGFTLLGSEWVLWVLIALSVLSVAVMVERTLAFAGSGGDLEPLGRDLVARLLAGDRAGAQRALEGRRAPAAVVAAAGIAEFDRGADAVSETMAGMKAHLRVGLERHLGILGTLGNNAPFIGLFGTVLGIIRAFADLSRSQAGGAGAVMSGISEALVATAVGLMVAIPAVIAFNIFQGKVRQAMAEVDAMAHRVLSTIPPQAKG
ncbi:MAG TPA: MotA/TolQ/ExbB proton channel family protein [Polyangia bacterium]|jgi:biopolymer transport protein ExbB|nr:MotA/TolQ/ExbB proton channel family protein [Polyangia bacterium]